MILCFSTFLKIFLIFFIPFSLVELKDEFKENKSLFYCLIFELIYIVFSIIFDILSVLKFNIITKLFIILNPFIYITSSILSSIPTLDGLFLNYLYLFLISILEIIYSCVFLCELINCNCKNCCKKTKKTVLIIKLTRYKYYKINDYILPSNFESMTIQEKINYLSIHKYNF